MKSENILEVIAVFKKVLPMAVREDHLKMSCPHVNNMDERCGTVHCHGGWFAIGACDLKKPVDFMKGGSEMAKMLELGDSVYSVMYWAEENIPLWGNKYGSKMFTGERAFYHETKRPHGAKNLSDIIDHWTEVYERVKATEQPSYPDITASLAVLPEDKVETDVVMIKNEMI